MTGNLFLEWCDKTFIPEGKEHQDDIGKIRKVSLVISNTPSHSSSELLECEGVHLSLYFFLQV
jgi:hypothetical protein